MSVCVPSCTCLSAPPELAGVVCGCFAQVKAVKGVKSVQRIVCGGCLDFKVVTALDAGAFGDWEASKFAPEEKFLDKIKAIDGVTQVLYANFAEGEREGRSCWYEQGCSGRCA